MSQNKKEMISGYLRTIAEKERITESEARDKIALAISLALRSSDPKIRDFWKSIPCEEEPSTIEEIIDYIAAGISAQQ